MKTQYILDTSIFVNPACAHMFGSSPTGALTEFLKLAQKVEGCEWLMPPSIYSELMHFADEKSISTGLLKFLHQQPPKKHEIRVPGFFVYTLVDEIRDRTDRGLRLAERHVREALQSPVAPSQEGTKSVRADAEPISKLRESYRRIMREGMLDSKADVDLLLLAYEVSGSLISADQGVLTWANNLGITIFPVDHLPGLLGSGT